MFSVFSSKPIFTHQYRNGSQSCDYQEQVSSHKSSIRDSKQIVAHKYPRGDIYRKESKLDNWCLNPWPPDRDKMFHATEIL